METTKERTEAPPRPEVAPKPWMVEACTDDVMGNVGRTPLVRLGNLFRNHRVFAKLEYLNPTSSVKDRTAAYILERAEAAGLLGPGSTIIESSSGNFGLSIAFFGMLKGYRVIVVVDPRVSPYFLKMYSILGIEVVQVNELTQGSYQLARIERVKELAKLHPNAFLPNQYDNPDNAGVHFQFTAGEILRQLRGEIIDYLVIGVSTGGTLSGIAERVKQEHPDCKVIAVDAVGSLIFDTEAKSRLMTGLGSNFISKNLRKELIDGFELVTDVDALIMARRLLKQESIFAGISSGAVMTGVQRLCDRVPPGKTIVTLIPDSGYRYIDTFFDDGWIKEMMGMEAFKKITASTAPVSVGRT